METLKKFLEIWDFAEKIMSPSLDRPKKYFYKKLEIFSNIKVDAKFACGSNGSTLSLWKSLPEPPPKKEKPFYFPLFREIQ